MDMYEILPYTKDLDSRIDRFVNQESVNGTFLQTRRFLNYHPEGRFKDASFVLHKSGIIVAYFPGVVTESGCWISHQGSTFGGPVISKDYYSGSRILEIIETADKYLSENFRSVKMKPSGRIFSTEPTDLLEYALEHFGYERSSELSSYTQLNECSDPLELCTRECRHNYRKSNGEAFTYRHLEDEEEFRKFYNLLEISKKKYNTRPVHTLQELLLLKDLFPEEILFRGIFDGDTYLSGMMLFVFKQAKAIHFQYVAPDESLRDKNGTTALYIGAMREAKRLGLEKFSWGISTEDSGKILNESLYHFKESFGAKGAVNITFTKKF
ncbi:MAG: GNAT family N-acetyltransferase [Fibrobacter sp.]|nr:GNAT family N-acetyltransferase [Fibrobacter sp.]